MYSSNEFLHSAGVSRHMQATGETPSQKTSMKRRSCEVPLGDISTNNFKVSLGDITNENNYDCRSLRSIQSEDTRSLRSYRPIDGRSVKNFRSSLVDVSGVSTFSLSRPPSYDQLSRRSFIEGAEGQGITSSIEGVLWSDEEENEYFYHENITSAWNEDRYTVTRDSKTSLFRIPTDPERARVWLRAIDKEHLFTSGYKRNSFLFCQLHFQESEYKGVDCYAATKHKLLKNAAPTLNLTPQVKSYSSRACHKRYERKSRLFRVPKKFVALEITPVEIVDIPPDPMVKFNISIDIAHTADNEYDIAVPSPSSLSPTENNLVTLPAVLDTLKKQLTLDKISFKKYFEVCAIKFRNAEATETQERNMGEIAPETPLPVAHCSKNVFDVRPTEFVNAETTKTNKGKMGESNEGDSVKESRLENYVIEIKEESSEDEPEISWFI